MKRGTIDYIAEKIEKGLYTEAEEKLLLLLEEFRDSEKNKEFADVCYYLAVVKFMKGDLEDAEVYWEDAISTYRRIKDTVMELKSVARLAQFYMLTGQWNLSLKLLKRYLPTVEKTGHKHIEGGYYNNIGILYTLLGNWKTAEVYLKKGKELIESCNRIEDLIISYQSLGLLMLYERRFEEAKEYFEKVGEMSKNKSLPREEAISCEYLGEIAYAQENYEEAKEYYSKALRIAERIAPAGDLVNQIERGRAELFLSEGKPNYALKSCKRALSISERIKDRRESAICYRIFGEVYTLKGNIKKAYENFKKAIDILEGMEERFECAKALLGIGKLTSSEDKNDAQRYLTRAESLFKSLPSPYWVSITKLEMARLELKENPELSLTHLEEAEKILKEIDEEPTLLKIDNLRKEIENSMVSYVASSTKEYSLLSRYSTVSEADITNLLSTILKRVDANQGFISIKRARSFEIAAVENMEEKEVRRVVEDYIKTRRFQSGEILYSTKERYILIPMGFTSAGIIALLYIGRIRGVPFSRQELSIISLFADLIFVKTSEIRQIQIEVENRRLREEMVVLAEKMGVITSHPSMFELLNTIEKIKDSSISVILVGETGTGKELLARAIHYSSVRKDREFVAVNCANMSETLLESELFGYKKGAFTDAKEDKKGWLDIADGGTLFLDEITEMGGKIQSKLLRFLETKELTPLGACKSQKVDVRVIAATNKDIKKEVSAGRFRNDLFFRLNGVTLKVPPLRERKEDIPRLVNYFISKWNFELGHSLRGIDKDAIEILMSYSWPGNIRELENEVRRAMILTKGEYITADCLSIRPLTQPLKFTGSAAVVAGDISFSSLTDELEYIEKLRIQEALNASGGAILKAAQMLGLPESTLRNKIYKYNLHKLKD